MTRTRSYMITVNILEGTPVTVACEDLFELCIRLGCRFTEGAIRSSTGVNMSLRVFPGGYAGLIMTDGSVRWYKRNDSALWIIAARQAEWRIDPVNMGEVEEFTK